MRVYGDFYERVFLVLRCVYISPVYIRVYNDRLSSNNDTSVSYNGGIEIVF